MIIAIDLDGVVFGTEEYYRTYAQFYDMEFVKNGVVDKTAMDVHTRFGWEQKYADDFYSKYTETVLQSAPIRPGAKYVLEKLKQMGHTLVCITLRGYYRDCEIAITEQRLKQENIVFDKIIYSQKNKLDACLAENVDVIVDDNPNTMELLSKNNIKCLHMRGAGLKSAIHPNITCVQNWADVLQNIITLDKK